MSSILYKVIMLAAVLALLTVGFALLPDAADLPASIESTIQFMFQSLYFFNDILDVATFLTAIYSVLIGIIWYGGLLAVTIVVKWGISTS